MPLLISMLSGILQPRHLSIPHGNSRKLKVFWYFQGGIERGYKIQESMKIRRYIYTKWVNPFWVLVLVSFLKGID